jgi:NADPH:quinone reductase-like Zn-dependent oxidoreductase
MCAVSCLTAAPLAVARGLPRQGNRSPPGEPMSEVTHDVSLVVDTQRERAEGTMRAVVQDAYGPPDILRSAVVERPEIGEHQVLVRVHAAGLDRGVWHLVTGLPYLVRLAGYGLRRPKSSVPGIDLAGRVEAVGAGVTRFGPGDEVFGTGDGSFAEYAAVGEEKLARKPANLTFEQAAAVPTSALTALEGLRDVAGVRAGQHVLVIGAGGGVGTFAVQIAKALGAEVTGVCSTGKVDLVSSLGADHVVDYTEQEVTDTDRRYDVIFDTAGSRRLSQLRRALAPAGTLVIVGGENGGRVTGGAGRQLRALLLSPLVRQRLRAFVAKTRGADLERLAALIEAGDVTPVVERTYPLNEASDALRDLVAGRVRGKAVIVI